jgi:hypothetical protein
LTDWKLALPVSFFVSGLLHVLRIENPDSKDVRRSARKAGTLQRVAKGASFVKISAIWTVQEGGDLRMSGRSFLSRLVVEGDRPVAVSG